MIRTTARSSVSSSRLTSPTYSIFGGSSTDTRLCQPLRSKSASRRFHSTIRSSPTSARQPLGVARVPRLLARHEQPARVRPPARPPRSRSRPRPPPPTPSARARRARAPCPVAPAVDRQVEQEDAERAEDEHRDDRVARPGPRAAGATAAGEAASSPAAAEARAARPGLGHTQSNAWSAAVTPGMVGRLSSGSSAARAGAASTPSRRRPRRLRRAARRSACPRATSSPGRSRASASSGTRSLISTVLPSASCSAICHSSRWSTRVRSGVSDTSPADARLHLPAALVELLRAARSGRAPRSARAPAIPSAAASRTARGRWGSVSLAPTHSPVAVQSIAATPRSCSWASTITPAPGPTTPRISRGIVLADAALGVALGPAHGHPHQRHLEHPAARLDRRQVGHRRDHGRARQPAAAQASRPPRGRARTRPCRARRAPRRAAGGGSCSTRHSSGGGSEGGWAGSRAGGGPSANARSSPRRRTRSRSSFRSIRRSATATLPNRA